MLKDGLSTVSESTVLSTELTECFGPHRVKGRELSEFFSVFYLCANQGALKETKLRRETEPKHRSSLILVDSRLLPDLPFLLFWICLLFALERNSLLF